MKLFGNPKRATLLIFVFIVILCLVVWRSVSAAEIDLATGVSFGPGRSGPVLGMDFRLPQGRDVDLFAGTLVWGETTMAPNNWDWHAGFRACRWQLCASLGASYLQRVDAVNGSHTNYFLGLTWRPQLGRLDSIGMSHLSNAGTSDSNLGRNAALAFWRLQ